MARPDDLGLGQIELDDLVPTLVALKKAGLSVGDMNWLRKPGNAAVVKTFMRRQQGAPISTLLDMILAAGIDCRDARSYIPSEYFEVDPERFSAGGGKVICFDRYDMTQGTVLAEVEAMSCVSGSIETLLAYGAEHPENSDDWDYGIRALGSPWTTDCRLPIPCLRRVCGERSLTMIHHFPKESFGPHDRFLVVSKLT
jgi:hypothetical protein